MSRNTPTAEKASYNLNINLRKCCSVQNLTLWKPVSQVYWNKVFRRAATFPSFNWKCLPTESQWPSAGQALVDMSNLWCWIQPQSCCPEFKEHATLSSAVKWTTQSQNNLKQWKALYVMMSKGTCLLRLQLARSWKQSDPSADKWLWNCREYLVTYR